MTSNECWRPLSDLNYCSYMAKDTACWEQGIDGRKGEIETVKKGERLLMKMVYVLEENAWLIYEDLHGRLFVTCTVDNNGELCIMVPWNFTAKQSHRSQPNTVHTCFTPWTSIPITNSASITNQNFTSDKHLHSWQTRVIPTQCQRQFSV